MKMHISLERQMRQAATNVIWTEQDAGEVTVEITEIPE